jgi:putative transposase
VQAVLARLMAARCALVMNCSDNGPELIAAALKRWLGTAALQTLYIDPGKPWQNAFAESLNNRLRDELPNVEMFCSLQKAQVLAEDWRRRYNMRHPHSALGGRPPRVRQPVAGEGPLLRQLSIITQP